MTLLGLALAGRDVVAVGGGPTSARRVADLVDAGARVTVIAPYLCEDLADIVETASVTWHRRDYQGAADLAAAWLVHTATGDPATDARVAQDAQDARTWCVNASSHRHGSAVVPARGRVATADGTFSVAVHAGGDPRRAAVARTAAVDHLSSGAADLRAHRPRPGWVALVGAGPGDDQLVTRRAATLLASADVVVTDRLVPRALVEQLPDDVRVIDVGKSPGHHPVPQEEINRILVAEALQGHGVVRFKGGDPYVLGRGGEERLACDEAGIRVEVVPGVTSAVAVPAAAGIPVTHRGLARGFTVVTGHDEDLPRLPTSGDHTLLVLMGVSTLRHTARRLVEHGRAADCPVAVVEHGCTPRQRVTTGTLSDIADRAAARGVRAPAVVVVGDVVTVSPHWPPAP